MGFTAGPSSLQAWPGPSSLQAWPVGGGRERDPSGEPAAPDREPARSAGGGHRSGGATPRRGRRVQRLMMEELRQQLGATAAHLEGHTTGYLMNHPDFPNFHGQCSSPPPTLPSRRSLACQAAI